MTAFVPHPARRPALISGASSWIGASSGIGAATAAALAASGHPVALGARRVAECEALAEKIRADGREAYAGYLDVTDGAAVEAFVAQAEDAVGPIDIAVSSAGELQFGKIHEMTPDDFRSQVDVHLLGRTDWRIGWRPE